MYGDTAVIRARARQMRERAGEIRAEAGELVGRVESVAWHGLAADAMRHLARDHAARLHRCADAHESAADALDRHAREVDHLKEVIAAVEHRVLHLLRSVGSAAHGVAGLVDQVMPDPVDDWVASWARHFDPPPHGSREWLDVRVPEAA